MSSSIPKSTNLRSLARYWGVRLAGGPVCPGHKSPAEFVREQIHDRPAVSLWHGPRGSGKSFLSGFGTWIDSLRHEYHGTRILGGSLAQSQQIYVALDAFDRARPGRSPLKSFSKTAAVFTTGSEVSILAASRTAVRGPHVARLRLDEVDEIDEDLRESALGMCMGLRGVPASVVMTSTWHRVGGPMGNLIERGRSGEFPVSTFCVFEVLERCPDERSGKHLENCPACPLLQWCHADSPGLPPRAKRSNGHYTIDSLIQKLTILSPRVFASDYLCQAPRGSGVWFTGFDDSRNLSAAAVYDPALPVYVSVDSGVFAAAVLFQVRQAGDRNEVHVIADYLSEGKTAEESGLEILALVREHCGHSARRRLLTDSAGGARNPVGPTVFAEYERIGLPGERGIECWPRYPGSVSDGLALLEALVRSADDRTSLLIHPRCKRLAAAFANYARAKRSGQWQDYPEDPQHPHEDLIDALRGGLKLVMPEGRKPPSKLPRVPAAQVF